MNWHRPRNSSLPSIWGRIGLTLMAAMVSLLLPVARTTPSSAAQLGGFGDPLAKWQAVFPRDTSSCSAANCYGPRVPNSSSRYEFSYVTTAKGRVDGFDVAFRRGTPLLRVELRIEELFPADVQMGSLTVIHHDSLGNSCAVFNLQSKVIERTFGKRAFGNSHGTIGVEVARVLPNGTTSYSQANVDIALVVPTYLGSDANC